MNKLMLNLSRSDLFKDITLEELEKISNSVSVKIIQYNVEELIHAQDEKAKQVFVLLEGTIKGVMADVYGHIYQVEQFEESDTIAPSNLFSSEEYLPISLIAKTACKIISFNSEQILSMFSISRKLEKNFLRILSDKVRFLATKLWENQFYSIEEKMYRFIFQNYEKAKSEEFEISETHEELSQLFGVSRPSLSRSLVKINQVGIIISKGKKIKVLDLARLKEKVK